MNWMRGKKYIFLKITVFSYLPGKAVNGRVSYAVGTEFKFQVCQFWHCVANDRHRFTKVAYLLRHYVVEMGTANSLHASV